ncbi:MAG: hypothetical protein JXA67_14665, partial [Micromonosporaceae bacterium]|nr:hypothetical protein [Micromonosporaceae bacterium]
RDFPVMYTDGCDPPLTSSAIQDKCVYGDPASNQVVVLFGDSHAGHWFPALDAVAKQRHWKLIPYSKSACSAASVLIRLKELKREYTECVAWRNTVVERLKALHPFMVIMSSVGDGGVLIGGGKDIDRSWTDKWMETVARVKPFTSRVVLIADTPWPAVNVPDCVSSHPHDVSACSRPVSEAIAKPHRREMVNQAASRAGVSVIDPTAWFCWSKTCPVIIGNTLVYRDASHVSAVYAALLAPVLWERLK